MVKNYNKVSYSFLNHKFFGFFYLLILVVLFFDDKMYFNMVQNMVEFEEKIFSRNNSNIIGYFTEKI